MVGIEEIPMSNIDQVPDCSFVEDTDKGHSTVISAIRREVRVARGTLRRKNLYRLGVSGYIPGENGVQTETGRMSRS